MAGWSDLPLDILYLIAQRLSFIEDFASFSAVCKTCRSVTAILKNKASLPPRYPQLMLAEDRADRGFFNLLTSKTNRVKLPEASCSVCLGAPYGWLLTLGVDLQINLLHPFSRQQICLPPMLTLPDQYEYDEDFTPLDVIPFFVTKVAMSASPLKGNKLNDECVIVAIYGECAILAFTRLRDTVWTNIQVPFQCYDDIVYYKGKFYAVDCRGVIVVIDIDINNGPKATPVACAPFSSPFSTAEVQKYLVELSGDLLLVSRTRKGTIFEGEETEDDVDVDDEGEVLRTLFESHEEEREDHVDDEGEVLRTLFESHEEEREDHVDDEEKASYYTDGFFILKVDESRDDSNDYPYKFKEVTTLGDRALFLGKNVSISTAASDCVKANCIYFTDDNYELYFDEPEGGGHDTGIFNMEHGTVQFNYTVEEYSFLTPPLWYL